MTTPITQHSPLLSLPAELLHHILTYLPARALSTLALTSLDLAHATHDDRLWALQTRLISATPISTPHPLPTFRDLYLAHHPHWFLVRNYVWFSDAEPYGKLIVCGYDERRQCIEAYAVTATKGPLSWSQWERDRNVVVHGFDPEVRVEKSAPVLRVGLDSERRAGDGGTRYGEEVLMQTFAEPGVHSSLQLCRGLPERAVARGAAVWPPLTFPAASRTRNESSCHFRSEAHRPRGDKELSQETFRLRKWASYAGRHGAAGMLPLQARNGDGIEDENTNETLRRYIQLLSAGGVPAPSHGRLGRGAGGAGISLQIPESVSTFATLPRDIWTPTAEKPWQGVWVGDYSAHGCEFLAVVQDLPGEERVPLPKGLQWLAAYFRGEGREGTFEAEVNGNGDVSDDEDDEEDEGSESSWASALEHNHSSSSSPTGNAQAGSSSTASTTTHWAGPAIGHIADLIRQAAYNGPEPESSTVTAMADTDDDDDDSEDYEDYELVGHDDGTEPAAAIQAPLPTTDHNPPTTTTSLPDSSSTADASAGPISTQDQAREPKGRLSAVKLTGDPNIPRGEYTFIAPDIGEGGFERIADEELFKGARVVRSCGHIAGRGFRDDQYTPSQLIMVSHDRLAQFWEGFGHISFYQKVDLEALLG
ncbi:hypothetical protein MBLNU230_g2661t1 [Neophaeotheca triangularis]